MLLDQRAADAMYNVVYVYTHPTAAMGMGEHVGTVSKAYLLPLGDIIISLEHFTTPQGATCIRRVASSRKWLSLSNLFGGTNAPSCAAATLKTIQDGGVYENEQTIGACIIADNALGGGVRT